MIEQWKDVVGYENLFQVSNLGRVRNCVTGNILKPSVAPDGHLRIATKVGGRSGVKINFKVHRLVAEAFLPEPSKELTDFCAKQGSGKVLVRPLDDDKVNNTWTNLAWGSYKDNREDFMKTERFHEAIAKISGSRHYRFKQG